MDAAGRNEGGGLDSQTPHDVLPHRRRLHLEEHVETEQWGRAALISSLIRKLLALTLLLVLGLVAALAALIPPYLTKLVIDDGLMASDPRALVTWPTKMALAPVLAREVTAEVNRDLGPPAREEHAAPQRGPEVPWPRPELAKYPWEEGELTWRPVL